MAVQRISRAFKDISLSFDPHPVTKDLQILKNEDAIRRSVRNIVETGSDVRDTLFDFVDFGTASIIGDQIQIAIENFETRVNNVTVKVNPQPDRNSFECTVTFEIIGQEFPTQNYTFLLEATR